MDGTLANPESTTKKPTVIVDPGHGGQVEQRPGAKQASDLTKKYDLGAEAGGIHEADLTLPFTTAFGEALKRRGYEVDYTRTTPTTDQPDRDARGRAGVMGDWRAGQRDGDYFIRIHYDKAHSTRKEHFLALYHPQGGAESKALAAQFAGTQKNGEVHARTDLSVLRPHRHNNGVNDLQRPAVLLEVGNMSHPDDLAAAQDPQAVHAKADHLAEVFHKHVLAQIAKQQLVNVAQRDTAPRLGNKTASYRTAMPTVAAPPDTTSAKAAKTPPASAKTQIAMVGFSGPDL